MTSNCTHLIDTLDADMYHQNSDFFSRHPFGSTIKSIIETKSQLVTYGTIGISFEESLGSFSKAVQLV